MAIIFCFEYTMTSYINNILLVTSSLSSWLFCWQVIMLLWHYYYYY